VLLKAHCRIHRQISAESTATASAIVQTLEGGGPAQQRRNLVVERLRGEGDVIHRGGSHGLGERVTELSRLQGFGIDLIRYQISRLESVLADIRFVLRPLLGSIRMFEPGRVPTALKPAFYQIFRVPY